MGCILVRSGYRDIEARHAYMRWGEGTGKGGSGGRYGVVPLLSLIWPCCQAPKGRCRPSSWSRDHDRGAARLTPPTFPQAHPPKISPHHVRWTKVESPDPTAAAIASLLMLLDDHPTHRFWITLLGTIWRGRGCRGSVKNLVLALSSVKVEGGLQNPSLSYVSTHLGPLMRPCGLGS